ncbi:GNAT family N-acetyltransferase [Nocardioides sp. GY 10127]|uniref:GNAT family N-acetyltransferase n=1 Tax=Nocardioides sp. GY 10127 TaxID=2569762 RepID=UPI0010A7C4CA|nr:GNAT family N-acetyltransferase [Nocardioides sp. GY 10127]TIC81024.1 GNAT family N-acetyltransferase [Nocardioides sp. GY 10127]
MARSDVTLREARVEDALFLAEVWAGALFRGDVAEQVAHLEVVVKTAAASPQELLLVAEVGGSPAGAVLLRVGALSPLDPQLVVQSFGPQVVDSHRRHGVGRRLLEAATEFAEHHGVSHVVTAAAASSREANRFMARLGLRPLAVVRSGSVLQLRARIEAQRPDRRSLAQVRAQAVVSRRSVRRRTARPEA